MLPLAPSPNAQGNFTQQFIARLPQELQTPRIRGPFEPTAVFPGALAGQLTVDQERRLVEHILLRQGQLELELGRNSLMANNWWMQSGTQSANNMEEGVFRTFMGRQALWDMVWHGQMQWRQYAYGDSIFTKTNQHVPLCRNMAQEYVAEAQNSIFGTSPWMGLDVIGRDDEQRKSVVERWVRLGFDLAKAEELYKQAVVLAVNRGHVIVKPAWADKRSYYQDWLTVALDTDGQPLLAQDGDYVSPDDAWQPVKMDGGSMWILQRDGQTWLPDYAEEPEDLVFDQRLLDVQNVDYQGLDLAIVRYQDFLAPLDVSDLNDADICIHLIDRPSIEVLHDYLEFVKRTGDAVNVRDIVDYLRQSGGTQNTPESHQWSQRPELGETASLAARMGNNQGWRDFMPFDRSIIRTAEAWVNYPIFDDGVLRKLFVQVDLDARRVISYDFEQRVVPKHCGRPFHVVRINPVDGRWHGSSVHEVLWPLNYQIDLALNRIHLANQSSGAFRFVDSSKIVEAQQARNPMLFTPGPGTLYHVTPNTTSAPYFEVPVVEYNQEILFKIIQYSQQILVNLSAAAGPNDDQAAGLETSELATGIMHLEEMRKRNFVPILSSLREGLEGCSFEGAMHILAHVQESRDALRYFDGDEQALAILMAVTPENFRYDLKLTLSRFKSYQKSIQIGAAESKLAWYAGLPPAIRPAFRWLVEQELQIYELPGAVASLDFIDQIPAPIPIGMAPPTAGQVATQTSGTGAAGQLQGQLST